MHICSLYNLYLHVYLKLIYIHMYIYSYMYVHIYVSIYVYMYMHIYDLYPSMSNLYPYLSEHYSQSLLLGLCTPCVLFPVCPTLTCATPCLADGVPFSWWVGWSGERHPSWTGAPAGAQQCGCGLDQSCLDVGHLCSCGSDKDGW